jgi:predicted dehydrogenase
LDGKQPIIPMDGEEGLRDLRIVDAIYEAVRTGKKVKV